MSVLYRWPDLTTSGDSTISSNFRVRREQVRYHHSFMETTKKFVEAVRAVHSADPDIDLHMDKPIMNRLDELAFHTVPIFRHVTLCSEMVLEHTHTIFKQWLSDNTHRNVHISSVERALGKDWIWRVALLHRMWEDADESSESRGSAEMGLHRVLLGEDGLNLDCNTRATQYLLTDMINMTDEAVQSPVDDMLRDCLPSKALLNSKATYYWCVLHRKERDLTDNVTMACMQKLVESGAMGDSSLTELEFYRRARFMGTGGYGRMQSYR